MHTSRYPSLYQINTRVWLTALGQTLGRRATLDDIPDAELDRLQALGFDWVWMLSVWQTGLASQRVSRSNVGLRHELEATLPDLREADICGSGFAITQYNVHKSLGGDEALARLRQRLRTRGLKLMLDFVPNHVGLDHPWIETHPDYFITATAPELETSPQSYVRVQRTAGEAIFAYGRDPNSGGWTDTLQLNYGNPALQQAMREILLKISQQCDGLRCDMAMLVLPEVFERTWGIAAEPFWPQAIATVREQSPSCCFLAEVYWDLEWTLQQQGFNYAYDKRLYDRLRLEQAPAIHSHLQAPLDYQDKLARFLENHDEPRAAATFPWEVHKAAAIVTYFAPGLRFFQQGQLKGRLKHISPHLCRGPRESINAEVLEFYEQLLELLRLPALRSGDWQLLDCRAAWQGNETSSAFLVFAWSLDDKRYVVTVNYAPHVSQCHAILPWSDMQQGIWTFHDLLGGNHYDWHGRDLQAGGLYLDEQPWQTRVFEVVKAA